MKTALIARKRDFGSIALGFSGKTESHIVRHVDVKFESKDDGNFEEWKCLLRHDRPCLSKSARNAEAITSSRTEKTVRPFAINAEIVDTPGRIPFANDQTFQERKRSTTFLQFRVLVCEVFHMDT
jgi:hypothetical protein